MAKVIKIDDLKTRNLLELYTEMFCKPDEIKFHQDGLGQWVMSTENLTNWKYLNPDPEKRDKFIIDYAVSQPFKNIVEVINFYGVEIDYVPPATDLL